VNRYGRAPDVKEAAGAEVHLSIVSHTNVGKTTLMRTLTRQDIGEVADRAHVTMEPERHVLVENPEGDALYLWDTPGFGDSARLLRRLRASGNPIGWFLTQVWDRFTDRPFFSSQEAIRNVRDQSDVVLYLVNAAEDPLSAGYVEKELEILGWIGKPVLVLLNQMGPPRGREVEAAEEAAWSRHVAGHVQQRAAIALDAFARCWVQEDRLLGLVAAILPEAKRAAFARLRDAWRTRNMDVFDASARSIARQLAMAAADREAVAQEAIGDKARRLFASVTSSEGVADPAIEGAAGTLAKRLDVAIRASTQELIELHGLSGRARGEIPARLSSRVVVTKPVDVAQSSALGGLLSGALTGLAADIAAGGMTLGLAAIVGGIVGALGAGSAAYAYNQMQGHETGRVGWSAGFLDGAFDAALLRYLAVSHFGRGRGAWVEGEYPAHWPPLVAEVRGRSQPALDTAWKAAIEGANSSSLEGMLFPIVRSSAGELLSRLYPEATAIFAR
jgi:hypothetical protein